jgi:hypothetical protein
MSFCLMHTEASESSSKYKPRATLQDCANIQVTSHSIDTTVPVLYVL